MFGPKFVIISLLILLSLSSVLRTRAFTSGGISSCLWNRCRTCNPCLSLAGLTNSNDDASDDDLQGPERSRMPGFIRNYLDRNKNKKFTKNGQQYTHLIAIPLDACHELQLELESVQRAILYHCPVLVHACITSAMTRLPLLYVDADPKAQDASGVLHTIVQKVVKEYIVVGKAEEEESDDSMTGDGSWTITANEDGIEPWLVPFAGLEVDPGSNCPHQTLCTVAAPNTRGTSHLIEFAQALQKEIQKETGWNAEFPIDPTSVSNTEDEPTFRPRIPFMRLPEDWEDLLRREYQTTDSIANDDEQNDNSESDDDFMLLLTSEKGGNGISPIFWAQWMEDSFGGGAGETTRMREVAVYRRRTDARDDEEEPERSFYLPELSVPLPFGNVALSKQEKRFQTYQEDRMLDAEEMLKKEKNSSNILDSDSDGLVPGDVADDILLDKTREKLEALYSSSGGESIVDAAIKKTSDGSDDPILSQQQTQSGLADDSDTASTAGQESNAAIDDWTRQRIEKAVASRARVKSMEELARKKDKPPIANNPVFQKYKDGTLVPEDQKPKPVVQQELPPFPSREHCTGFWRMIRSPTGFAVEDGTDDSSRTDNLVLRVDGTTAGGPILDQETRQKASGGTWRLLIDPNDDDEATLRIRLVIPPKKNRILVMQGLLEKASMSSNDLPLTSSTFGIPMVEERLERVKSTSLDLNGLFYCRGKVWIEDAVTGKNRDEVGGFSIMKLTVPTDPSQFTVTIPKPVRNQD